MQIREFVKALVRKTSCNGFEVARVLGFGTFSYLLKQVLASMQFRDL